MSLGPVIAALTLVGGGLATYIYGRNQGWFGGASTGPLPAAAGASSSVGPLNPIASQTESFVPPVSVTGTQTSTVTPSVAPTRTVSMPVAALSALNSLMSSIPAPAPKPVTGLGAAGDLAPIASVAAKGGDPMLAAVQTAVNRLGYVPALNVDGKNGPKTIAGVKWAQVKLGFTGKNVDGIAGPMTQAALAKALSEE